MMVSALLTASVVLQFTAAAFALRLIRITGRRWAWVLIAAAIVLMGIRRAITLIALVSGHTLHPPDVASEWVALIVSVFILAGVASIAPLFRSLQESEEALRESRNRYHTLAKASPVGIFHTNADGHCLYVNERWCGIAGLSPVQAKGRGWVRGLHPEDRERIEAEWYRAAKENLPFRAEYRFQRPDGTTTWVFGQAVPETDAAGRVTGYVGTVTDITESKQAEESLGKEKNFYESTLNSLPGVFYVFDDKGSFLRWNKTLETVSGYSSEEIRRMSPLDFIVERDRGIVADRIQEVFSTGQSAVDAAMLSKDGREIPHFFTGLRHVIDDKPYVVGMGIDVSERQRTEEALRENEARIRAILETAADGIITIDERGIIESINTAAERIFGYTADELIGQSVNRVMPSPHRERHDEYMARYLRTGEPHIIGFGREEQARRKDGTVFPIDLAVSEVRLANRRLFTGIIRDITQRKEAQAKLHESERVLSTLMSNLPGMAYRCRNDRDWTMEFVSEGCLELTGHQPDDLIDNRKKAYADLIHPDDREPVWNDVQSAVRNKRPFQLIYRITTAGNEEKWVWEQGQGVFASDHELVALEGFITDITERRRLEEQLRQAQKMEAVGLLAGGLAHDFNNILTAILGNVELMEARLTDGSRALPDTTRDHLREGLAQIEWAGQRAASLTRQLLAFSRRQIIHPKVLDLNRVLRRMEDMLRRLIGEDIRLTMNLAHDLGNIHADAGQVEQVVMNLVVNARDAMPGGGELQIKTENITLEEDGAGEDGTCPGLGVMLAVSDAGCGMDRETTERIFEPFFTTKHLGKGTGLGLATVFGIVRQAGGTIRVYSEPGRGTTFRLCWPRVDEAAVEPGAAAPPEYAPGGTETVLVVEDEDSVRLLAQRILEARGYTVLSAENGRRAIELADRHEGTIHLLISDVVMPDVNGVWVAEALTAVRPEMKVLYLSGYTSSVIADRGVLKEGVEFLEKPFSGATLARRVRDILDRAE